MQINFVLKYTQRMPKVAWLEFKTAEAWNESVERIVSQLVDTWFCLSAKENKSPNGSYCYQNLTTTIWCKHLIIITTFNFQ